ncbi:acetyltransferase [Periweissella cryptocerci]|uniref:Acetyltransferase n=1 Tax=Periweissella cryptocerci TaxID=2506420 RepID=A0A4V1AIE3_9LACO|nr:acyltransferase family protein [Periweissella cryptocerci]QBO35205.1 acetyltransferase [Periweissella cryptocerci]
MGETHLHRRYISGFDGVRAIAVLAVILYHIFPNALPGGYLGVPIFFVVSGYLITDLLRQELANTNKINLRSFYERRIKRLYPALLVMLVLTAAYITLFDRGALLGLRATILTNLVYVYNFWEINHGQSYFQQFTAPSPFTHLWSLSIEGQFYLVWPVLVWLLAKFKLRASNIFKGLMILAFVSAALMALKYNPENINRVYYGTDTRLFTIIFGAALAYIWPSTHLSETLNATSKKFLNYLSFGALGLILLGFFVLNGQASLTYYGGMFVFGFVAMIFVGTIAHPSAFLAKPLSNRVFRWIGTRSYGIYLYQYPVLVFFEHAVPNYQSHHILYGLVELIIIGVISELSYRYLERPLQHINVAKTKTVYGRFMHNDRHVLIATGVAIVVIAIFSFGLFQPQAATGYQSPLQVQLAKREREAKRANKVVTEAQAAKLKQPKSKTKKEATTAPTKTHLSAKQRRIARTYNLSYPAAQTLVNTQITAIGDSMLINVGPSLQKIVPTVIDGQIGRQPGVAPDLLHQRKLMPNILVMLGTNGLVNQLTIDQVMKLAGTKRQVFWVNNFVANKSWIAPNVKILAKQHQANFHLINWHALVRTHQDWLGPDGIHPNTVGDIHLTNLIASEVARVNAKG